MEYYVIYRSTDVGWYQTKVEIVCVVENEIIAKDFCDKFRGMHYIKTTVGTQKELTETNTFRDLLR
jgi:hypothetical protein